MQVNVAQREITIKLVYYGPALSGKTTNLSQIHQLLPKEECGKLMTLETRNDRTLFFDLLPLSFDTPNGFKVKAKIFTVPGQVVHNATRRVVLQHTDGVAFIADSQVDEQIHNRESYKNLLENLRANRLDSKTIPIVVQFNKQDLGSILSEEDIRITWSRYSHTLFYASAIQGRGVAETFSGLLKETLSKLDAQYDLASKFAFDRDEFIRKVTGSI